MTSDEATVAVFGALDALSVPFMAVGSLSSNFYGVPRSTQDADIVIQWGDRLISELSQQLGPAFRLDPQMVFESVGGTTYFKLHHTATAFRIELFLLSDDPHDQERFSRRLRVPLLGRQAFVPTAEDVIITKLRWFDSLRRNKDMDDIRDVISVQRDRLDWDYIHSWCDRHGTRALLDEIRSSIPPE